MGSNGIDKLSRQQLVKIEEELSTLKSKDVVSFKKAIAGLKQLFAKSTSIEELNKLALVFQTFKIHSAVPLVVEKLQSGKYDSNGGTLVYAIMGLRKKEYRSQLVKISKKKQIIWEMKAMFDLLGINNGKK